MRETSIYGTTFEILQSTFVTPTHLLLAVADYRRLVSPGQKSFAELYGVSLQALSRM